MTKYVFVLLAFLLAGCSQPKARLNVLFWGDYLDSKIVADFERQFDCKVSLDFVDDNDPMIAKLAGGGLGLYDIVSPSTFVIPAMVQRGLLSPLRHEAIPNFRNIDPEFANTVFDPGNRYSVPLSRGTTGILIRKQVGKIIEETWGLIFDPVKQPGSFLLIEDPRGCIDAAMHFKGHEPNSTDPKKLAEARDLLVEVKMRSRGFAIPSDAVNRLLAKEVVMTMAFSTDAVRAMREDPDLYYFLPREGGGKWMDSLAIPSRAPHQELAEKFINYLLDSKVGAQFCTFNFSGTPNKAVLDVINPSDRNNPVIYPPPEVMRRLWYAKDLGEKQKLYDELWTQIKAK